MGTQQSTMFTRHAKLRVCLVKEIFPKHAEVSLLGGYEKLGTSSPQFRGQRKKLKRECDLFF